MKVFKVIPKGEILPKIGDKKEKPRIAVMDYEGETITVNPGSLRLHTLKRSQTCTECGREGIEFRVEAHIKDGQPEMPPHLALYSEDGVLMVKTWVDRDGPKDMSNTKTMCQNCCDEEYREYQIHKNKINSSG